MPVSSTSTSPKPTNLVPNGALSKPKRLVRRRGRRQGEMSDEEVEREALTDSDASSAGSDSESGVDDEIPSIVNGVTSNAQFVRSTAPSPPSKPIVNGLHPVIPAPANWSDMVTAEQEGTNDSNNLPVVDFENLSLLAAPTPGAPTSNQPSSSATPTISARAAKQKAKRKAKKEKLKTAAAAGVLESDANTNVAQDPLIDTSAAASTSAPIAEPISPSPSSQAPARPPKPNPRQAYLERLSNDPSYVPRVGAFWGHDDRLMDKELRSMSPWWRGRKIGRGRGGPGPDYAARGRGFVFSRGRGGPFAQQPPQSNGTKSPVEQADESSTPKTYSPETPVPTMSAWPKSRAPEGKWVKNTSSFMEGFEARGRGRGRGAGRGSTPNVKRTTERPWTKPLDHSLQSPIIPSSKAAPLPPSDVRVKIPGSPSTSVPVTSKLTSHQSSKSEIVEHSSDTGSFGKAAIVKLPSRRPSAAASATTAKSAEGPERAKSPLRSEVVPEASEQTPSEAPEKDPFVVHVPAEQARFDITRQTLTGSAATSSVPASAPAAISSFAPPPFPAPVPASFHLPPGVAVGENGMLFELATGRPVILQQQPPPVFHPRLGPYTQGFAPVHNAGTPPAGTPPLLPQGPYGYPAVGSPHFSPFIPPSSTLLDGGAPIFVPARSSGAIPIRAPSADGETSSSAGGLNTTNTTVISGSAPSPKESATGGKSRTVSSLRTSTSALAGPPALKSPLGTSMLQPQYGVPYANGGYYHAPEYGVYAPVPMGMDGHPQQYSGYPDMHYGGYAIPAYDVYGYGPTYYGNPYGAPPSAPAEGDGNNGYY